MNPTDRQEWTPGRLAPSTALCGCMVEPIPDNQPCDLCSEGTGLNDGRGWRIVLCPKHAAAPELYAALSYYEQSVADYTCGQGNLEAASKLITASLRARAALAKARGEAP